MMIVASIVALISASGLVAAADGPVWPDCSDVKLWNPGPWEWFLKANCPDNANNVVCSELPLDACFTDINGQLQPSENGAGLRNCQGCTLQGSSMYCQCRDRANNYQGTTTDLK
ncbi:CVNH domain-containing protein [Apiospora marii]|uniref:CVNH domain-containing protein n=1 Tax=Apiospora marii TaxID=335849 RepID=A0ABR1RA49_9PEZI